MIILAKSRKNIVFNTDLVSHSALVLVTRGLFADKVFSIDLQVAAEVAAPLSQAKKITMVSSGNGTIGAEKLTEEVLNIVTRVPELVKNLTGVDIAKVRHRR